MSFTMALISSSCLWTHPTEQFSLEVQTTTLRRPHTLKRQLWPIYDRLTFFPSKPCYSLPSLLSFTLQEQPSHLPKKPSYFITFLPPHNDFSVHRLLPSPCVSHTNCWFPVLFNCSMYVCSAPVVKNIRYSMFICFVDWGGFPCRVKMQNETNI